MPPPAPAPGGGPAPPPAPPLPAPATPHSFTRCRIGGTDDTLDYVRVPAACKIVKALPDLGWVDASSASPGHMAAPILKIAFGACTAATADWATPPAAIKALLTLSELLVAPSLPFLTRCADALDGLGVYDKVYKQTDKFLDAVELAVGRAPNPSPFELQAGDLVETTTFLNGGSPGVPAVAGVAAVAAVRGVRGRAGVPAVRAVRAVAGVAAIPAVVAVPASGPAELRWLHLVRVEHRLQSDSACPLLRLWQLGLVVPDRLSVDARDDATSRIRDVASLIEQHLKTDLGTVAEPASVARHFRRNADRLFTLPDELRCFSFDGDALELELIDDLKYKGDEAARNGVLASDLGGEIAISG